MSRIARKALNEKSNDYARMGGRIRIFYKNK